MPNYDPLEGVKSIGEVLDDLKATIKKGATEAAPTSKRFPTKGQTHHGTDDQGNPAAHR